MNTLEIAARRFDVDEAGRADDFGVVGGLIATNDDGGACALISIAPEVAHVRLVLHPDDVARLVHTPLPDGRVALDIVAKHDAGSSIVIETGCRHGTTGLYWAMDDIVADIEGVDEEVREAAPADA